MLLEILYALGGMAIGILAMLVCFAMVLAVPGTTPKTPAETFMKKAITALIILTPIWAFICVWGYADGWVFGEGFARFFWIPLILIPIGLMAGVLTYGKRLFK